jgi:High potential iron-sulfur protein
MPGLTEMKVSRRITLRNVVILAGLAAAPWARPTLAQGKASKQAMHYQDQPKDGQKCATCVQFIPGEKPGANGECQVVEGPISPDGWCIEYIKKS